MKQIKKEIQKENYVGKYNLDQSTNKSMASLLGLNEVQAREIHSRVILVGMTHQNTYDQLVGTFPNLSKEDLFAILTFENFNDQMSMWRAKKRQEDSP